MRLRATLIGLSIAALLVEAACQMRRPVARGMPPGASTVCLFGIRGVRAFVHDTADGVDVTFVVVGDGAELRRRAHAAMTGDYPLPPESQAIARRVRATIHDEASGMTIRAVPIEPDDLERTRDAIRHRLDEATSDACE